jgi:hypothetical protein
MSIVYQRGWQHFAKGIIKWDANLRAILVTSAYIPNPDHDYIGDLAPHEASGRGCLGGFGGSGRKYLTGASIIEASAFVPTRLCGPTLTWPGINAGTIGGIVIAREWSSDADSPLILFLDTGGYFPIVTNGGTLTVSFTDETYAWVT